MSPKIVCQSCGAPYPEKGAPFVCMSCGGIFDYDDSPDFFSRSSNGMGMWQYRRSFEVLENSPMCTLGEGSTPLIWDTYKGQTIGFKQEHLNPTGSYKDRGTSVLVSHLLARGVTSVVEDSSGNAGASLAAYAARSGLKSRVFIPESASGPKTAQIAAFGSEVVKVIGARSEAAKAVRTAAEQGVVYASHAFMPFGLLGIATIAYEIYEQAKSLPGTIIAPVGHGGLLWGMIRGFEGLLKAGKIKSMPFFVGVQAEACAPLVNAYTSKSSDISACKESQTLAEGVKVTEPVRGSALLKYMKTERGLFMGIEEAEIATGYSELARRGLFVEPTSALVWNALELVYNRVPDPIILVLTGSGLKFQPKVT